MSERAMRGVVVHPIKNRAAEAQFSKTISGGCSIPVEGTCMELWTGELMLRGGDEQARKEGCFGALHQKLSRRGSVFGNDEQGSVWTC